MNWTKASLWGGSIVCLIVWLASVIVYLALPSGHCLMNGDLIPLPNSTGNITNSDSPAVNQTAYQSDNQLYVVSLPTFCLLSLIFLFLFFIFLFYQLFSHEQLSHELMLEDLADTAIVQSINQSDDQSNNQSHPSMLESINQSFDTTGCCRSFTQKLLVSVNSIFFILLLFLSIIGIGSVGSVNQYIDQDGKPVDQPESCQRYKGIGIDLLVLDFSLTASFFMLACYRCVTKCISNQSINQTINLSKLVRAARRKNLRNNVRYSAVDRQSMNQFDQHTDDEDDDLSIQHSHNQSNSKNNQFHEDLELLDMLDAHSKHAKSNNPTTSPLPAHQITINQSVPTLAAPPTHQLISQPDDQQNNQFPGDEDDEEYDYGDINIEDEEEELTLDDEKV